MKYLKAMVPLAILIGIAVLFNLRFRMNYTPAGIMGEISPLNIVASSVYIIIWSVFSFLTGFKEYRSIFIGGTIYSLLPYLGMVGSLFIGSPLAILIVITFYLGVPVQGIGFWMVFSQLPIMFLGNRLGKKVKTARTV